MTSQHRRLGSPRTRRLLLSVLLAATVLVVVVVGAVGWSMFGLSGPPGGPTHSNAAPRPATPSSPASAAGAPGQSPARSGTPPAGSLAPVPGKLVIGIGDEADRAVQTALAKQSPVKMLTSWFDRESDFGNFMDSWRGSLIPQLYRAGYAMHVVQWAPEIEGPLSTKYGPACGRAYALSGEFLADMKHLAQIFGGDANGPPLYVTLFTEFSTYPCVDDEWDSAVNYYQALKDQYRQAYQVLHANAANVHVSLGFGGWLGTYDYPEKGGGTSLIQHFTDIMAASDFQSFQAMATDADENAPEILEMTRILHRYGPVMLAHYKPDNDNQATFDKDVREIFTDSYVKEVTTDGLFAMSFMTTGNVDANPATFQFLKAAVARYGRSP